MNELKVWKLEGVKLEAQEKANELAKAVGLDVGVWISQMIMNDSEQKISKAQLHQFIRDTQGQLESYHAHKERMAWQAVALFQLTAIAIGGFGFDKSFSTSTDIFLSILLVIAYLLALGFVRMQLNAKNSASDMIGGCIRLLFNLNSKNHSDMDLSFPINEAFPNIIKTETEQYGQGRRSNRDGICDSLRLLWDSIEIKNRRENLLKAWTSLVDYEKQELIIATVMTLTVIVTIIGVVLPPVSGGQV